MISTYSFITMFNRKLEENINDETRNENIGLKEGSDEREREQIQHTTYNIYNLTGDVGSIGIIGGDRNAATIGKKTVRNDIQFIISSLLG